MGHVWGTYTYNLSSSLALFLYQCITLHVKYFKIICSICPQKGNSLSQTIRIGHAMVFDSSQPFSHTSRTSQNNSISYNRHVFPGFSVVLIQLRSHFCQNVASLDILCFSHHFFHFTADFVTLSYTKMAIFPTLKYTVSSKKTSLSGGASPYSPL